MIEQFVVVALAVFRLTRLLIVDSITDPIRDYFTRWEFTDELLACPWCTSIWLSVPAAAMFWLWPELTYWLSLPFAFSAVAGLLSRD